MRIERSTRETNGSAGEPGLAPAPRADGPEGHGQLRLPAHHLHLIRVFHGASPGAAAASRTLTPNERRAIRERLLAGTYAAPQVIDELARRLLARASL